MHNSQLVWPAAASVAAAVGAANVVGRARKHVRQW
jgi:hypothetical protein